MKRTFTVTIEGIEGDHAGTVQRYLEDAFPRCCVNVTETTTTRAKEREVINKANALIGLLVDYATHDADMEIDRKTLKICVGSVWSRLNDLIDKARELRALMAGKR